MHGGLRPYNGLLSWAGPSCYDERPAIPAGQKTPYLTTSALPKPKASRHLVWSCPKI
ncbi:Ribosomal large subunit pseudouridine synthase D [Pseudomonas coronafaciens pv. oryzae]|nr:Ribosomal large subunit pseudouridine synthase D [Pseudomonas coronafaciens pv. oryzae]